MSDLRSFTHPNAEMFEDVSIMQLMVSTLRFLSHEWKDKVEIVAISGRFLASKPLVGLRESEDVLSENLRLRSGRQNLAQPQDVILKKYLNG